MLGALLFVCGAVCMATKRNAIGILMGVELVLNGATVNFVAFAHFNPAFEIEGQIFALFVIVMAAAEAASARQRQLRPRAPALVGARAHCPVIRCHIPRP